MDGDKTTLVMAGSREARGLIAGLLARNRRVIASLPEPERMFGALPVPTRVGGFAAPETLRDWLQENNVGTVMDASHAFDSHVTAMISKQSRSLALPYLRVLRPAWHATAQDLWLDFTDISTAAHKVPARARVFSNTGWPTLPCYAGFKGTRLFMRQTHAPSHPAPFPFVEFVPGEPPFSQIQEQNLFRDLGVSHLICRNVGGAASMSKLLAARKLGIPVLMVARAPLPHGIDVVETVAEALAWEANT